MVTLTEQQIHFNYTNAEGVEFDTDDSVLISFVIHVAEDARPGVYNIHTDIHVLEGEEEERLIFEGTDLSPERFYCREGNLDGYPGEKEFTYYTADYQTYVTYSSEEKTFTVNADKNNNMTYSNFRSLYIDGLIVDYNNYTKENGSLKLTLKPEFMDTLAPGDHELKFIFADGEAYSNLYVIQGAQEATEHIGPYNPDYPYHGSGIIGFDAASAGWSGTRAISFFIYGLNGEGYITEWGSKNKSLTWNDGDIWYFDAAAAGVQYGHEYGIIFVNLDTYDQTAELLLDTSCFGDTAYANRNVLIENPVDSNKSSMEVRWVKSNLGPIMYITSLGNVVGESIPSSTSAYQMFVNFLADKGYQSLTNALKFNGKDAQSTIDDIASQLGLTKDDVIKAINDAKTVGNSQNGDKTDWSNQWDASRSPLPGGTVEPTEPPTDSYGYIQGAYYLTGSINGDNSGTSNVHKNLRFKEAVGDQMILNNVRLAEGDVVRVARYNGGNTFTIYPDGIGRDVAITQSGRYDFYFKPYELGNGNYWYITPSYLGEFVPYLLGDADGNGDVEIRDATYIQHYLVQIETPFTKNELMRGDVDGSGDLELTDVTAIQYYLCHLKTPYPIGEIVS